MTIEEYLEIIMCKFKARNSEIIAAFDLQDIQMSEDPDDFLTTTVIEVKEVHNGYLVGQALISSNNTLKENGWTGIPNQYHYHKLPVWYKLNMIYWQLGDPPPKDNNEATRINNS